MQSYQPAYTRSCRAPQLCSRNPSQVYGSTTCAFITPMEVESRCCFAGMVPTKINGGDCDGDHDDVFMNNTAEDPVIQISSSFPTHEVTTTPKVGRKRERSERASEDAHFVEFTVHLCRWGDFPGCRRHRVVGSFWFEGESPSSALYQAVQSWAGIPGDRQRIILFRCVQNGDGEYLPIADSVLAADGSLPKRPSSSSTCVYMANEGTSHLELSSIPPLSAEVDETGLLVKGPALRYFSVCTVVTSFGDLQFASPSFIIAFPAGKHIDPSEVIGVAAKVLSRGSSSLQQHLMTLRLISLQVRRNSSAVRYTEVPPIFVSAFASSQYERKQARRRGIDVAPLIPAALQGTVADYTSGSTAQQSPCYLTPQLDRVALVLNLRPPTFCTLHVGKEPLPGVASKEDEKMACFATATASSIDGHHTFQNIWISDVLPV